MERKSNVELLRIVAIFMVVMSHYAFWGIMDGNANEAYMIWRQGTMVNKIISSTMVLGNVGVGIFFLISGYFLITREKT